MANTNNPNGFKAIGTLNGAEPAMRSFLLDESQTIVKKDPVKISVSGFVQIGAASDNKLLGSAAEDKATAAGIKTTKIKVYLADTNTVFEGQCSGTPTQALIGGQCDVEGSTGIFEVNEDLATKKHLKILEFHPADSVAANARVRFVFHPSASQLMGDR